MTDTSGPQMLRSTGTMLVNKTGSWRFLRPRYLDKTAPCAEACPAGADIALTQNEARDAFVVRRRPFLRYE